MTAAAKILGGVLVVFSTSAYGFLMSGDLQKRLLELKELKKIIFLLKGEIGFGMTPILEAAGNIAGRCGFVFGGILRELEAQDGAVKNGSLGGLWKSVFDKGLRDTHLSEHEKERLVSLGDSLGLTDTQTQINALEAYMEELDASIEGLSEILPAKTRLYRSLGVMLGVIITIIMV
ncbi:MAG: stage III sporulation protein AB [Butyrivibrio sp.]|nr:stage III sporulation protein AB [Butyrivibrio sp.]